MTEDGKGAAVLLTNQEIVVLLLKLSKSLESLSLDEGLLEEEAQTLELVVRLEKHFEIEKGEGTLGQRIKKLIDFLCPHPGESAELKEQVEEEIQHGMVPDKAHLDEWQEQLAAAEGQLAEIEAWAKILAQKTTLPPQSLVRILRLQAQTLAVSEKLKTVPVEQRPAVDRILRKLPFLAVKEVLSKTDVLPEKPEGVGQTEKKVLNMSQVVLKSPELREVTRRIPPSARAAFQRQLKRSLSASVRQAVVGVRAGLGVEREVQVAAQNLAQTYGFSSVQARQEVEGLVAAQEAVLREQILAVPGSSRVAQGQEIARESTVSLAAAKTTAEVIRIKAGNPGISPRKIARQLGAQAVPISREVEGVTTGALSASQQKTLTLNIQKIVGQQAEATGHLVSETVDRAQGVVLLAQKYGLPPPQARKIIYQAEEQERAFFQQILEEQALPLEPEVIEQVAGRLGRLVIATGVRTIPDSAKSTPRLGSPRGVSLEKEVGKFLREKKVPRQQMEKTLRRLKPYLRLSSFRTRAGFNKGVIRAALERNMQKLGLLSTAFPSPELLAVETMRVAAQKNDSCGEKGKISEIAGVVTDRLRPVKPEVNTEQVGRVLEEALLSGDEPESARIALERTVVDHPQEVIVELDEAKKTELALEELGFGDNEQLAGVVDFLRVTEIEPQLYSVPVSKEQIPEKVLEFLEGDLGAQEEYSYGQIVRVLNTKFTFEQAQVLAPDFDDEGKLTPFGAIRLLQISRVREPGELSRLDQWWQTLEEESKQGLGRLRNVIEQRSRIVQAVANNPIYRFRQRISQATQRFLRPVGDWAVRTVSFGRFPTLSAVGTAARNWFLQTGVGQAAQSLAVKATQKAAEWAVQAGAKKLLSSAAVKTLAAGLSTVLGVSTGGVSLLIQAGLMALGWVAKKVAGLGKKILGSLGIDTGKIEGWFKKNIPLVGGLLGKVATGVGGFTVAVVGGLLAVPAIAGMTLIALVAGPIILVIILSLLAGITTGSAQWDAMQGRGFSPGDIGGIELTPEELAALGEGHLALGLQNALSGCGISRVTSSNLTAVDTCLSGAGFSRQAIETIKYSAEQFNYLQCVGFVVAVVPGFSGGGDAYSFVDHPPPGWHSASGPAQIGDVAVWGPSANCQGSCDTDISCCGHVAVVTGVEYLEGLDYLYVTQAWGESGRVSTVRIPADSPTTILTPN
ncbi:CHAP domain-containing protein [Candidatus Shapirobacteria bacterium]|nr:CHAP domain-containing protein [Candidatus Shapirobacteria bacterium]